MALLVDSHGRPWGTEEEERADAWANAATGLGVWGVDKSKAASYLPVWRVLDQELTNLMNGSDLTKKVVSKPVDEMFRRGFQIEADGVQPSERDDFRQWATENLEVEENLKECMRWGRLYGGCLLHMNIDDGRNPWEPLDEDNIRSFDSMALVDRRYSYVQSQYAAMTGPKYGKPEVYLISNAVAGYGWNTPGVTAIKKVPQDKLRAQGAMVTLVHESRVIRFDGNPADVVTRQNLAGWSWSVMQVIYDTLRQFDGAFDSAMYLLQDASQGVLKLKGLFKQLTSGNRGALSQRLQLLELSRSVLRSVALDADSGEEFTRVATPLAGIADLLEKVMARFAAGADIPQTVLFGRSPAGMDATGQSDLQIWYDGLGSEQENKVTPKVARIFRLLSLAKKGPLKGKGKRWTVKWHPLYSPTDKELAQTRLSNAQRDQIYLQEGVIKPEEVAVDLEPVYPNLDVEAREAVLEGGVRFNPYENEPSPDNAAAVNAPGQGEPLSPKAPVPLMGTSGNNTTPGTFPPVDGAVAASHGAQPPLTVKGKPGKEQQASPPAKAKGKDDPAPKDKPAKAKDAKGKTKKADRFDAKERLLRCDAAERLLEPMLALRTDSAIVKAVFEALLDDYRDALLRQDDDDDVARKVYLQLAEDYPERLLGWVLAAHWQGPIEVPTDQIDSSNRDSWTASHDGRLASFKEKIAEGLRKPAVLVKTPKSPLWKIVDGHHRYLGHEANGMPLLAYVAEMHTSIGPWDTLHDSQRTGKSGPSNPGPSWKRLMRPSYSPSPSLVPSLTPPSSRADMMPPPAAIGIVRNGEGRIMAVRHVNAGRYGSHEANMWSLPGGTLEEGETPEQAIKRELQEETNIVAGDVEKVHELISPVDGRTVHVFVVTRWKGEPKPDAVETNGIQWMTAADLLSHSGRYKPSVRELRAANLLEPEA